MLRKQNNRRHVRGVTAFFVLYPGGVYNLRTRGSNNNEPCIASKQKRGSGALRESGLRGLS